jgi:glycosyltransferase involved in cell wall biosynthesis
MKVLVFTSLFPNNIEENKGIFIKERMKYVAKLSEIKVVAPVPFFPPIRFFKKWYGYSRVKTKEESEGLEVFHPRFFVSPKIGMSFYGFFMFLGSVITVKHIKKTFDFDLIDAHYVYPDGFAAVLLGKLFNVPVIVSARGSDINVFPKFFLIRKEILYVLRNVSKIISVSSDLMEKMVSLGIEKKKISVIPNGIDSDKFKKIPQHVARQELGLSFGVKIIISVGNIVESKGFQFLIEAFAALKKYRNDIQLVIIGGGTYEPVLKRLLGKLNLKESILLIGSKPHHELYKWYNAADVFCLASLREGWPNVLFEALICGLPVVATRVGGIPEAICKDIYGILVNQGIEPLVQAIDKALDFDWNRQALIDYAKGHTWDKTAQSVYQNFCVILNYA